MAGRGFTRLSHLLHGVPGLALEFPFFSSLTAHFAALRLQRFGGHIVSFPCER